MNTLTKTVSSNRPVNPMAQLVKELLSINGCRFVQLHYTSKGAGEEATHTLAMGVNLERAYRRDEKVGRLFKTTNVIEEQAKTEVLESLRESLEVGIGNNSQYTCAGVYEFIAPGIKYHKETGALHIYGFVIRKNVITPGKYKTVNSSAKTLAKKKMKKHFKINRFRQFILTNISKATLNGTTLVLG